MGVDRQWRSQNAEMWHTSKGYYWIKKCCSSIESCFKVGISLKGKNLLPRFAPEGSEFFPFRAKNLLPRFAPEGSKFFPLRAVPY